MKTAVLFCLALAMIGCATVPPSQMMVNPDTGKAVKVAHHSWGYGVAGVAAAVGAQQAQKSDINSLKKAGFVEIEKVATIGIYFAHDDLLRPAIIGKVHPTGPADQAGMKSGDTITERNGQLIKTLGDLKSQPRANIGDTTDWKVSREGKTIGFTTVAISASQLLENK